MKKVLIVFDKRFVVKATLHEIGLNLRKNGIEAIFVQVAQQSRPIEVYSFDNLPEATMEVFRQFIEAEAVVPA